MLIIKIIKIIEKTIDENEYLKFISKEITNGFVKIKVKYNQKSIICN